MPESGMALLWFSAYCAGSAPEWALAVIDPDEVDVLPSDLGLLLFDQTAGRLNCG